MQLESSDANLYVYIILLSLTITDKMSSKDRIKSLIKTIEIMEIVAKVLPIVISFFTALTLIFAIVNFIEGNIVIGILLLIVVSFGLFLLARLYQTHNRSRESKYTTKVKL